MMKKMICFVLSAALLLSLTACGKSADPWQEQYDLGVRYLSEGNYEEAIIAFTAAIEIDPKREEAYVGLADVYYATGDTAKAEEILSQIPTQGIASTKRYDHDDGSYTIFEYDADGNNVRSTYCAPDGTVQWIDEYDFTGRVVRRTHYDLAGAVEHIFEYEYARNILDVVVRYTYLGKGTNPTCEIIYTMQNEKNHVDVLGFVYGSHPYISNIVEYDSSWNIVYSTYYSDTGTIDNVEEY